MSLLNLSVLLTCESPASRGCMSRHRKAQVSEYSALWPGRWVSAPLLTLDICLHMPATAPLPDSLPRSLTTSMQHTEAGLSPPPSVCHAPNNTTCMVQLPSRTNLIMPRRWTMCNGPRPLKTGPESSLEMQSPRRRSFWVRICSFRIPVIHVHTRAGVARA